MIFDEKGKVTDYGIVGNDNEVHSEELLVVDDRNEFPSMDENETIVEFEVSYLDNLDPIRNASVIALEKHLHNSMYR